MEEVTDLIVACWDFKTLVGLAGVSKEWRHFIREVLFEQVTDAMAPFLKGDEVLPFFDMLYSVNGVVFGEPAQQIACPGSGAGLWPSERVRRDCLNHQDMNILVPGPDALQEVIRWLRQRSYVHWRAMVLSHGLVGSSTHFAAGVRSPDQAIPPRVSFRLLVKPSPGC